MNKSNQEVGWPEDILADDHIGQWIFWVLNGHPHFEEALKEESVEKLWSSVGDFLIAPGREVGDHFVGEV